MILHGNARGGGRELAVHLLRTDENEHVEVHEVSGFVSRDIAGVFGEIEAVSKGTKCRKPLFSLSLSPPRGAHVTAKQFDQAIAKAEEALDLKGQPRVVVFHEKGDHRDRHCHVVWSRVEGKAMKAIPMPFNRMKMRDVSRELFIEHGWDVPKGLINRDERNPLNFTLDQYQQDKRTGRDARQIKADIQDAWAVSDTRAALEHALEEKGFRLARGERRGFVVTDHEGEVYSLPKWLGVKTKTVRERLGSEKDLPELKGVQAKFAADMATKLNALQIDLKTEFTSTKQEREQTRRALIERQRKERADALAKIEARQLQEAKERQSRFRHGLKGLWDFVRGESGRIKRQNEAEAAKCQLRDEREKERLISRQRDQRRAFLLHYRDVKERYADWYRRLSEERARHLDRCRNSLHHDR